MSLLDAVRAGVKTANKVTAPLQCDVLYYRCTGDDGYGSDTYASPVTLKALVEQKQRLVKTANGKLEMSQATITFLDVAALLAATGTSGMSVKDKIVLPDGRWCPVLNGGGFVDAGTTRPVLVEVAVG